MIDELYDELGAREARETAEVESWTAEEVPFCDCTNEELEAGRICAQPHCPNR